MTMIKQALGLLVLATALTACGGGGGHHHSSTQASSTNFTSFVKGLFANTSDTAEPASINNRNFNLDDNNNTDAYNSVLASGS